MTTPKKKTDPPENLNYQPPALANEDPQNPIIAQLMQQVADLTKQVAKGNSAQAPFDPSQSPFEHDRRAEHKLIKQRKQRTKEGDADPNLVWCGTRYQVRSVPRGYVPVEHADAPPESPRLPEQPKGAVPGRSALPITIPGDVLKAGG